MNKLFFLIISLLFLANCSFNTKSKLWSNSEKIKKENSPVIKEVFKKKDILQKEFNQNIKINLKNNFKKNSFFNNLTNNNGQINFDGELKKVSKYKFKKIDQFKYTQPELIFTKNKAIIFFDNKGTILKFDQNSKKLWKQNHYTKREKKLNPSIFFASDERTLIAADNLSNYYALNVETGNLLWKRRNSAPFNSQIKIYEDKFFAVDFDNVLKCFSLKNGKELWNFKTERSFIKSQQKLSLIIHKNKIIFMNTLGDVSSLDIKTGNLIWQTPTQSNLIYENAFSLKNSDLVLENELIYFSNNKNQIFAMDFKTGFVKWQQNINSNQRPTIIGNLLFTVSYEGYLIIIDSLNGNIIRMTNIFDRIKNFKKNGIEPNGFIVGKEKIFLSLSNGKIILIDIASGKSLDIVKIGSNKISRPYIMDSDMFLIRDNAILKIN